MKPRKIVMWRGEFAWNWHAVAGNGKILASTNQGYARRNTAVRYMESVTDAKRRGIPVMILNHGTNVEVKLY